MHKNSHSKMEWFKKTFLNTQDKLKILDVGSLDVTGRYNYSDIFNEQNWSYTGLDIEEGHNVDIVVKEIYNWVEIEDNAYDVVISGQFFEHLEFFWLAMSQIKRVLKPNGYVCIIVPSSGPNHGGNLLNCYKFYEDGLEAMAKYVDLDVVYASVDTRVEAKPWYDACLIAYNGKFLLSKDVIKLESDYNDLKVRLDSIIAELGYK